MDQDFFDLSSIIKNVDWDVLRGAQNRTRFISNKELESLRRSALTLFPSLKTTTNPLTIDLACLVATHKLKTRSLFLSADIDRVHSLQQSLQEIFPAHEFLMEHRINNQTEHSQKRIRAGCRALFDIVGFQIVPRDVTALPEVLKELQTISGWQSLFVFNTLPFTPNDFGRFIGPTSCYYYRATHFYCAQDGICAEIQVRPPVTHEWSKLHHATVYKPTIELPEAITMAITAFGAIANKADYQALVP